MSWSESFKILRRDIHQLLQLDTRSFIHSKLERTLASRGSQTVMFQVEWDFEAYVESELDKETQLSGLRTFTKLAFESSEAQPQILHVECRGLRDDIVKLAQQLAWMAAIFRIPDYGALSLSRVFFEKVGKQTFRISLFNLQRLDHKSGSCWHPLFVNSVIGEGFSIPPRDGEQGLEIPFEVMAVLARVWRPVEYQAGIILKGTSTALIPTSRSSISNSMQWHYVSTENQEENVDTASIFKNSNVSKWHESRDLESLRTARTFLGFYIKAEVHLGTKDSEYGIRTSNASVKSSVLEIAREASTSIGSSVMGLFTGMLSLKVVYPKGLQVSINLENNLIEDHIWKARQHPLLLYDVVTKRGWLVPELSVTLHMVHIWASCQPNIDADVMRRFPYADPAGDGGQSAWEAIDKAKNFTFRGILDGTPHYLRHRLRTFFAALRSRRDVAIEKNKTGNYLISGRKILTGWEFNNIVNYDYLSKEKEVPINVDTTGGWERMIAEHPDIVVLFCENLGEPIRPGKEEQICESLKPVPTNDCYLIASIPCLKQIALRYGTEGKALKLTSRYHWHRPEDQCGNNVACCNHLHFLAKDGPESEDVLCDSEGAALFGRRPAKLTKSNLVNKGNKLNIDRSPFTLLSETVEESSRVDFVEPSGTNKKHQRKTMWLDQQAGSEQLKVQHPRQMNNTLSRYV
ncbi:MAG: hypothetical protein MMC33_008265 [Icmadophila ericetorum]|nr:hypothetical protein [Icmadophila ericetorum]